MELGDLRQFIEGITYQTLLQAEERSTRLLAQSRAFLADFLAKGGWDPAQVSFAVIGSAGRHEALEASDFDLLPVAGNQETYDWLLSHNVELRGGLAAALQVDVSQGRDLTKTVMLSELCDPEKIGGEQDGRTGLTQRILILAESSQAGGELPIEQVRREVLDAYAHERSAGRHPLAFCNDLARYYRTVCLDYKARVDITAKDWCTRNVKLRHARKFWYFSSLLGVASIPGKIRPEDPGYVAEILAGLSLPPYLRLFRTLTESAKAAAGRVLDQYAWYLAFMADPVRRSSVAAVQFDSRYERTDGNPFPALQHNARLMQREMIDVLDRVDPEVRGRVLDWFLL